jgi:hypothetical protein
MTMPQDDAPSEPKTPAAPVTSVAENGAHESSLPPSLASTATSHFQDYSIGSLQRLLDRAIEISEDEKFRSHRKDILAQIKDHATFYLWRMASVNLFIVPKVAIEKITAGSVLSVSVHSSKNFSSAEGDFAKDMDSVKNGLSVMAITKDDVAQGYLIREDLAYELLAQQRQKKIAQQITRRNDQVKSLVREARQNGEVVGIISHLDGAIEYKFYGRPATIDMDNE